MQPLSVPSYTDLSCRYCGRDKSKTVRTLQERREFFQELRREGWTTVREGPFKGRWMCPKCAGNWLPEYVI